MLRILSMRSRALLLVVCCIVDFSSGHAFAQNCGPGVRACIQALGFLPGTETASNRNSTAVAISADGTTVIGNGTNANGLGEAFRWVNGTMTGLGKLPGTGICSPYCSSATGVSGDGAVVVGTAIVSGGPFDGSRPLPFRWSGGTMAPIMPTACQQYNASNDYGYAAAISADASTIVGNLGCSTGGQKPYRSFNGSMSLLDYSGIPSAVGASPGSVSANGSVIVGSYTGPGGYGTSGGPFRWINGTMTALPNLPGFPNGSSTAVTPDGAVVYTSSSNGACCLPGRWTMDTGVQSFGQQAYGVSANGVAATGARWTSRDGFHDFGQLLLAAGVSLSDWPNHSLSATSVSADGMTFAGIGTDASGKTQAFIARLPLPVFHDFNADGRSDIVWRNSAGDNAIWFMNGAMISSVAGLLNVPTNWYVVGQRDFNGDGKTNLLWASTTGDVAIWLMNGSSILSVASLGNVGANWGVAGTGDFDGDGKGDILWRSTAGNNAIWLMNGTTISLIVGPRYVPTNWAVAGIADFDGDGKSDIFWRNSAGDNAIWLMSGASIASIAGLGNVPTNWSIVGTADFDGDGKGDILWRNGAGDNAIWLMNGTTIASVAGLGNIPTNWSIVSAGDYNGDGKGDILWRSTAGDNAIWFMNGTTLSSISGLGNVPTNWTIQNAAAN